MTYQRKAHLALESCPSSLGADPPIALPLDAFVLLPFAARCAACSRRVPVSAIPGAAGVTAAPPADQTGGAA